MSINLSSAYRIKFYYEILYLDIGLVKSLDAFYIFIPRDRPAYSNVCHDFAIMYFVYIY